jgi:hypothetical protein
MHRCYAAASVLTLLDVLQCLGGLAALLGRLPGAGGSMPRCASHAASRQVVPACATCTAPRQLWWGGTPAWRANSASVMLSMPIWL